MKVFISINNLECGGAQKSLISLLNYLKVSNGMDAVAFGRLNIIFSIVNTEERKQKNLHCFYVINLMFHQRFIIGITFQKQIQDTIVL